MKGAFFEVLVRNLLLKAGYEPIEPDDVSIRRSDGNVRGRGYWHDIDALGKFAYPLLYMYPIRLLAEAKCYRNNVPIQMLRNFVGALKDISENYFVEDRISQEEMLAYKRYTDCGSFFSASGFTIGAQKFALAQGVFLISYESNPILARIVDSMNDLIDLLDVARALTEKSAFCRWINWKLTRTQPHASCSSRFVHPENRDDFVGRFRQLHTDLNSIQTSVIAMAIGKDPAIQYPIHMLSYQRIPDHIFSERDDHLFRVHYTQTRRGLFFRVNPVEAPQVDLLFSLPRDVYWRLFAQRRMLDFKARFLDHIELPTTIRGLRRILRLNLDQEWIRERQTRQG